MIKSVYLILMFDGFDCRPGPIFDTLEQAEDEVERLNATDDWYSYHVRPVELNKPWSTEDK